MYVAKRGGGGACVYAPEHEGNHRDRLLLSTAIHDAIAGNEFVLHYQPQVSFVPENSSAWRHWRAGSIPCEGSFLQASSSTLPNNPDRSSNSRTGCLMPPFSSARRGKTSLPTLCGSP